MKRVLSNKSGEGYINTAIKIIIAVVIGLLIVGGLYLLYTHAIIPNVEAKVGAMMNANGEVQLRREGTLLQRSYDGENWITIPSAVQTADTEVVSVNFITRNGETVWVVLTKDSVMYNACYTKDGTTWGPITSSRQQLRLSKNVKGTCLYLTYPGGMEYASNNGIDWELISTNNY